MVYQHRNRRGDVYLLQAGKTRTGKPRYYFGRKLTGDAVEVVPPGYEVFESPGRGQVFLRKKQATCIDPSEREVVVQGIRDLSNVEHFIVDVEEDCLVVYLPTMHLDEVNALVRQLAGPNALEVPRYRDGRDQFMRELEYKKALRFRLLYSDRRQFHVEQWWSLGSREGWLRLAGPAPLLNLVERYVEHLGKKSLDSLFSLLSRSLTIRGPGCPDNSKASSNQDSSPPRLHEAVADSGSPRD